MSKRIRLVFGIITAILFILSGAAGYLLRYELFPPANGTDLSPAEKLERLLSDGRHPLVFAHRGAHLFFPENSPESVMQALEKGYDGVELDVVATADGVPVISHDLEIKWNGETRFLTEIRFSELQKANQGFWKLDQVLDQAGGRILLLLEMKSNMGDAGGLEEILCREIHERNLSDSVILSSTDYFLIQKLPGKCGDLHYMFEYSGPPEGLREIVNRQYDSRLISLSKRSLDGSLASFLKKRKFVISVYTPNTTSEMENALRLGANLIQTDFPGTMTALRNRWMRPD